MILAFRGKYLPRCTKWFAAAPAAGAEEATSPTPQLQIRPRHRAEVTPPTGALSHADDLAKGWYLTREVADAARNVFEPWQVGGRI
jgi:hypothetical protein